MNVNQIGRSLEIYQNSISSRPVSQFKKSATKGNDTMTLSETARDYKTIMDALKTVPDVREDKVRSLREQISSNNYNVDAEEISEHLLKKNFDAMG